MEYGRAPHVSADLGERERRFRDHLEDGPDLEEEADRHQRIECVLAVPVSRFVDVSLRGRADGVLQADR